MNTLLDDIERAKKWIVDNCDGLNIKFESENENPSKASYKIKTIQLETENFLLIITNQGIVRVISRVENQMTKYNLQYVSTLLCGFVEGYVWGKRKLKLKVNTI